MGWIGRTALERQVGHDTKVVARRSVAGIAIDVGFSAARFCRTGTFVPVYPGRRAIALKRNARGLVGGLKKINNSEVSPTAAIPTTVFVWRGDGAVDGRVVVPKNDGVLHNPIQDSSQPTNGNEGPHHPKKFSMARQPPP